MFFAGYLSVIGLYRMAIPSDTTQIYANLMFDYVWQMEIIADDAPIEDGECLDSTDVFATVRPTLGANQGGHLLSGGFPDFSICTSW